MQSFLNRCLVAKPNLLFSIGFIIIVIIGVLGDVLSWNKIRFFPNSNLVGIAIATGGLILHFYCHRIHQQAHEKSQQIEKLVTTGIFQKIRHPMYLGIVLAFVGLAVAWGVVWIFIPSIIFSVLAVLVAIKEEEFLLKKFGRQYEEYMQKVPWRFIVKIF